MNKSVNPNGILLSFVWFFCGLITSFFAINTWVVQPHTVKANYMLDTVVKDAQRLENYGALTMVSQCQELGYAFVAYSENNGYLIECNNQSIAHLTGDEFDSKQGQYKKFASKLSDRPLVSVDQEQ